MAAAADPRRRVRIAVIGAGRIGAVHAAAVSAHPDAELVVIADPSAQAVQALAAEVGAEASTDVDTALTAPEVDAVVVASPTALHIPHTLSAVAAGKGVLMEKPVALEVEAVDDAIAALGDAAARVMVGFNRRFDPSVRELATRIRAGEIGEVEHVTIISRDPGPPPPAYLKVSGGIFKDMTIHDLDMVRHLMGEVTAVHAVGRPLPGVADEFGAATLTLTGADGALATVINSRRCTAGYDQRIEVAGSQGVLEVGNHRATSVRRHDARGTDVAAPYLPFFLERYATAYAAEIDAFVETVRDQVPAAPSILDGRAALALAEAAGTSAAGGSLVPINGEEHA